MGKVKQSIIDADLPDVSSIHPNIPPEIRVYVANDIKVTRDMFIMQLSLAIYDHAPAVDIRKVITLLITTDDVSDMITVNNMNFFSYMEFESKKPMSDEEHVILGHSIRDTMNENGITTKDVMDAIREHPIKKYIITYDIDVVPLIVTARHGHKWKKQQSTAEGTSFREAKENFLTAFKAKYPDRKIKSISIALAIIPKEDLENVTQKS